VIVVSDTSPISSLLLVRKLNLIVDFFDQIIVPEAVYQELLELENEGIPIRQVLLQPTFSIQKPKDQIKINQLRQKLDLGESEAIALALELNITKLLIDERRGYAAAEAEGLHPVGLLGVIVQLKKAGLVARVTDLMDELLEKAGFYIGPDVYAKIQELAGES
jgi:uncharacterized protein